MSRSLDPIPFFGTVSSLCCIISTALPDASTQTNKLPRCLMLKPWWFPIFTQIRTRCIILCNSRDAKMLKAQEKRMLNKLKKDSSSWSHSDEVVHRLKD